MPTVSRRTSSGAVASLASVMFIWDIVQVGPQINLTPPECVIERTDNVLSAGVAHEELANDVCLVALHRGVDASSAQ